MYLCVYIHTHLWYCKHTVNNYKSDRFSYAKQFTQWWLLFYENLCGRLHLQGTGVSHPRWGQTAECISQAVSQREVQQREGQKLKLWDSHREAVRMKVTFGNVEQISCKCCPLVHVLLGDLRCKFLAIKGFVAKANINKPVQKKHEKSTRLWKWLELNFLRMLRRLIIPKCFRLPVAFTQPWHPFLIGGPVWRSKIAVPKMSRNTEVHTSKRACLWAFGSWLSNRFFLNPKPSRNFRLKSVLELEAVACCGTWTSLNFFDQHIFEAQAILSFLSSSDTILGNSSYAKMAYKRRCLRPHFETKSRSSPAVGIVSALIQFLGRKWSQQDSWRPLWPRGREAKKEINR